MRREKVFDSVGWVPKTKLGKLVQKGEIRTIHDALNSGLPLRETAIVELLLPGLEDEVLNVNMVQRMTDSGRRVRFAVITVVGNGDGYVGVGQAKGKEVGPAIRKAIEVAKLNLIEIRRGCGSWECGCGSPHTLPFAVTGRCGSVRVTFRPAPRGVGLAVGEVAEHILKMAGIQDAWGFTQGKTRTTVNYAKAAFNALEQLAKMRVTESQKVMLNIIAGAANIASDLPAEEIVTTMPTEGEAGGSEGKEAPEPPAETKPGVEAPPAEEKKEKPKKGGTGKPGPK
jgi:small subunit ribosomal protein S5